MNKTKITTIDSTKLGIRNSACKFGHVLFVAVALTSSCLSADAQTIPGAPPGLPPGAMSSSVMGAASKYLNTPVSSPQVLAALKKTDPADAAKIQAGLKSGEISKTATFTQLPPNIQKSIEATVLHNGLSSAPASKAAVAPPHRNPFSPAYSVAQLEANVPPVSSFVSFVNLSQIKPPVLHPPVVQLLNGGGAPVDVALGRVSGIILSGGAHAIYEADGQSYILQPGDPLPDGAGRIVTIEPASVVVRISGDRFVRVFITANDPNQNPQNAIPGFGADPNSLNSDN